MEEDAETFRVLMGRRDKSNVMVEYHLKILILAWRTAVILGGFNEGRAKDHFNKHFLPLEEEEERSSIKHLERKCRSS